MKGGKIDWLLRKSWVRKTGWSLLTIIVPEATLTVAAQERRLAERLTDAVRKHQGEGAARKRFRERLSDAIKSKPGAHSTRKNIFKRIWGAIENDEKPELWTVAQSYYVLMGGFTIVPEHPTKPGDSGKPRDSSERDGKTLLTPQGFFLLWELKFWDENHLPPITGKEVEDKSKDTKITQLIVFLQALWMIANVVGRAAGRLPVTLLELHTCLHTFCALVTYVMWWDKPVDVKQTTNIPISDKDLLKKLGWLEATGEKKEPKAKGKDSSQVNRSCIMDDSISSPVLSVDIPDNKEGHRENMPDVAGEKDEQMLSINTKVSVYKELSKERSYLTRRMGLGSIPLRDLKDKNKGLEDFMEIIKEAYVVLSKSGQVTTWEGRIIVSVGFIYGSMHLAAWANIFPTWPEKILWRIAACITAISWAAFSLCFLIPALLDRIRKKINIKNPKIRADIFLLFFVPAASLFFLVRLFLLIESFVCLRALPLGSYKANNWSQFWPHAN